MRKNNNSSPPSLEPLVYVIDDDEGVLKSVRRVLESVGLKVLDFSSVDEFMKSCPDDPLGCVVTDIRMPHKSGLELQQELQVRGASIPIIFMTAYADVRTSVQAMKLGGFYFLEKPFSNHELIDLVNHAIAKSIAEKQERDRCKEVREMLGALSEQELKVLEGIMDGKLNKTTADEMGLSDKTIEYHRAKIMNKFRVSSVAELVRKVCLIRKY